MFDFVRNHQRLMQFILLLLIVPSFVAVGVSSYVRGASDTTIAKVADEEISQVDFDDAVRARMNQYRQRTGAQFDEALFNTPEMKKSVLDGLISQRVLKSEIQSAKLSTPDQAIQQYLLAIPGLVRPDGSFDNDNYKRILAAQGMNPAMYEASLRDDLAQQQLTNAVEGSAIVPKSVVAQIEAIYAQQREVQSLSFKAADYASQVHLSDDVIKAYYDKHSSLFGVPETANIEYVVLNADSIAAQISVTDEEIKAYYEQNLKNYTTEEQRRASHILIKVSKDASAADKAAAKAKAEDILAQVKKQPSEFAELAKKYSQDDGSAAQGGDLDYFGKGMMVKPFEDVAYKLKVGEISDLVATDFGFHIIEVTGIKPGTTKTLDQVKDEIVAEIKKQKAAKKFSEMADTFTNTVYEQADSLKPVAEKLKLTIQAADNVTRTANPALASNPVLSNPKFLKALFSDDVIKNKHNMETLDLGSNTLVSAHITEYKAASVRPLAEVKDLVVARVTAEQSAALAEKAGAEKLASLKAKPEDAGFSAAVEVSRIQSAGVPHAAFDSIMNADVRQLPAFVGVDMPMQGYIIFRINKVSQMPADEGRSAEIGHQINSVLASGDLYSFVQQLKLDKGVKILKPIVDAKPATAGVAQ